MGSRKSRRSGCMKTSSTLEVACCAIRRMTRRSINLSKFNRNRKRSSSGIEPHVNSRPLPFLICPFFGICASVHPRLLDRSHAVVLINRASANGMPNFRYSGSDRSSSERGKPKISAAQTSPVRCRNFHLRGPSAFFGPSNDVISIR